MLSSLLGTGNSEPQQRIRRLSIPASEAALSRYKVLVFNCYGTLIDWERGIYEALEPFFTHKLAPDFEKVFETLSANETRLESENYDMPYPAVLEESYRRTCADFRLVYDRDLAEEFGQSVGRWPAFADSSLSLSKLKDLGLILIILGNVDVESFEQSRTQLEAGWKFDAVCTAEDIGSYKPDLRNFRYVLELVEVKFGIEPKEVLMVAQSKFHDIEPAQKMGLKTAWIHRPNALLGQPNDETIQPDWEFASMEAFTAAMERANGRIL